MKIPRLFVFVFLFLFSVTLASGHNHFGVFSLAWRDGEIVLLERWQELEQDDFLSVALDELLRDLSPTEKEQGLRAIFSAGSEVVSVEIEESSASVVIGADFSEADPDNSDVLERISWILEKWVQSIPGLETLTLRIQNSSGDEVLIENAAPPVILKFESPPSEQTRMQSAAFSQMSEGGNAQPVGALSDASIFLSPGHGWHYASALGRWATQRDNNFQIIEDHSNGEAVLQYLHQYLWNAGARIYTTRERDLNTNMVIVQNGGAGYSQTGSWAVQSLTGAYGGSQRYATTVNGQPTATARFTPDIPEAGYYAVYVWYRTASGGTTTADARITINHTGDSTLWVQNQNRDGFTWKYIGTYYFEEGRNPETGSVVIDNQSSVAGHRVIAGAVRFGGGMGDVPDNVSKTISGKPRWEESGRYYAGFLGKSDWANFGTVDAMPRWAAWEHESWENGKSVYVSWHTNAASGQGTGTETFAYSSAGRNGPFNGVPGGLELRNFIHDHVIRDIRANWKSNWTDRGKLTHWFGEINPNNNPAMPAALIEIGFHDRAEDAKYLLDPEFRREMARAVYKGLVQFYANQLPGFNNATYLPEPPRNFRVSANADGSVELSWIPPVFGTGPTSTYGHAATGYRVYRSKNGYGFDNGIAVTGTSATLMGFAPGETVFLRVSATNAGGESFPTSTLAVRIPDAARKKLLIVNGFTRNDRFMNTLENDPHNSNPLSRGYADRLNTGNYIIPHARAIEAYPEIVGFDSAEAAAVENGSVLLTDYEAVIWMAGVQAQKNDIGTRQTPAFVPPLKGRLAQYQAEGGQLFVSGSEIAWDLNRENMNSWMQVVLKSRLATVTSASGVTGVSGSLATGWSGSWGLGGADYPLGQPGTLQPMQGGSPAMTFTGSTNLLVDGFETVASWWQPKGSGSTTGDGTFSAVANPVRHGNGAARLDYTWGSGSFIRVHRPSSSPQFSADSDFSIWVYGDNSGHRFRVSFRDSDGELFGSDYTTIDFTGWREIVVEDIRNNTTWWAVNGDGRVTGPNVSLESLQLSRATGPNTGTIYFDYAEARPAGGSGNRVAAIQYDDGYRLFYLGLPFEKLSGEANRADLMTRVLDFFRFDRTPFESWQEEFFTENELADPEISGAEANPSGDGIPNILKYALNLDPREPTRDGLPEVSLLDGALTLTYNRSNRASDIDFTIEISEDLVSWSEGGEDIEIISVIDEGETERITVRDRIAFPESGRCFMRLRVERE